MPTARAAAEPAPEQDVLLDVFTRSHLTVAHTASTAHPGQWWHLWTADGRYLGSANRPELLGHLIHLTR
ncbi:hypothetical protein [Streptomyces sp. TLI_171]|uniref:hypothetical protein n=1 Tax=Streptomyces sp. TLI_171 TaxID=1938859 RepID=UPI000C1A117C|nr:hypothetical protein [Streptomyces sp. TLI_171]RKE19623.1 hypothetical protein BX266_2950 [Streptomyces sp. TLI_171]